LFTHLFCVLAGGVLISMTFAPTGVLGFVLALPDKHVDGEHARRLDFLYERFRNKSLEGEDGKKDGETVSRGITARRQKRVRAHLVFSGFSNFNRI
jgi:hypothetical protein